MAVSTFHSSASVTPLDIVVAVQTQARYVAFVREHERVFSPGDDPTLLVDVVGAFCTPTAPWLVDSARIVVRRVGASTAIDFFDGFVPVVTLVVGCEHVLLTRLLVETPSSFSSLSCSLEDGTSHFERRPTWVTQERPTYRVEGESARASTVRATPLVAEAEVEAHRPTRRPQKSRIFEMQDETDHAHASTVGVRRRAVGDDR